MISYELSGNGESGRIGLALIYDYPTEDPDFGAVFDPQLQHPFGRPAYNLRLLNGTNDQKQAYLFYGGGKDPEGEFERLQNGTWLPGFISAPGGTSPGSAADYPEGPVKISNRKVLSQEYWHHYTWQLEPETIRVYRRRSGNPDSPEELLMAMQIPFDFKGEDYIKNQMNIENIPVNYNWFSQVNGLRIYFRSIQNAALANLKVTATSNFEQFASDTLIYQDFPAEIHLPIQVTSNLPTTEPEFKINLLKAGSVFSTDESSAIYPILNSEIFSTWELVANSTPNQPDTLWFGIESLATEIAINGRKQIAVILGAGTITNVPLQNDVTFSAYPNPFQEALKFKNNGLIGQVRIFTITGKEILLAEIKDHLQLETGNWEQGIYFVEFNSSQYHKIFKLIKSQ